MPALASARHAVTTVARAAGRATLLKWAGSAVLALIATLSSYALIGVAAGFLTACAAATLTHNNAFAWVYPSAAIRAFAITRVAGTYSAQLAGHRAVLDAANNIKVTAFRAAGRTANRNRLPEPHPSQPTPAAKTGSVDSSPDEAAVLLTDADAAASVLVRTVTPLAATAVTLTATCLLLARYSAAAATAFISLTSLGCAGAIALSVRAGSRLTLTADTAREQVHAIMNEAVLGRIDLWAAGASNRRKRLASEVADRYEAAAYSAVKLTATAEQLILITGTVAQIIVLLQLRAGAATVVALTVLAGAAVDVAAGVPTMCRRYTEGLAASRRLSMLIAPPAPPQQGKRQTAPKEALSTVQEGLQVSGVDYQLGARVIIDSFDLDASPGQTVRVTGESGSGKTTLLRLLAGELHPTAGSVRLNGYRPNPTTATYVGPDDYIVGDTIEANLRMGSPDATTAEMAAALSAVGLTPPDHSIEELLELDVGVGGGRLSGGQRGRLAIARAVLRRPLLLLLDEPNRGLQQNAFELMLKSVRAALPDAVVVVAVHNAGRALGVPVASNMRVNGHADLRRAVGSNR